MPMAAGKSQQTVLVVEDESIVAMLMEDMLADIGHEVSAVADQGHETFGRKRGERKFFRCIAGIGRGNVPRAATSGEFDKER